ncbi:MAG: hypothetical protein ABIA77_05920 [Candidatus Omnitrophota bacterium]
MLNILYNNAGLRSVKCVLSILLVLGLFTAPVLFAQSAESALSPEAQTAFNRGLAAARQQEWRLAIKYFEEAQKAAQEDSEVLFNLALAYDKADALLPAAVWFKAYLVVKPEAHNAGDVQERIDDLLVKYEASVWKLIESTEKMTSNTLKEFDGLGIKSWRMYQAIGALIAARVEMGDIRGAEQLAVTWKLKDQPYERRDELYQSLYKALACVGKIDAAKKYALLASPNWSDTALRNELDKNSEGFRGWQKSLQDQSWKENWGATKYEIKAWGNFFDRVDTFNNYTIQSPWGNKAVHNFANFWESIENKDPIERVQILSKVVYYMAAAWDYFQRMELLYQ